jgi:glutathione S-transferase
VAPRVYRIPFSTNVERVALAAGYKGIEVEWVDVDPADRAAALAVSGQSLVPVLVEGEEVIADSPRVLEWLERRTPEPPLYPGDPARRAEAQIFVDWFNRVWKRAPNLIAAEEEKPQPDTARIAEWSRELQRSLPIFESLLESRDYLLGDFGIADVVAFPFLKYPVFGVPLEDDERFHAILVEHQPLGDGYPHLRAWVERVDGHPRA